MKPLLGLRDPLFALSLLAIDPGLGGVVIAGPPGTGKSLVARAARVFWPARTPFVEIPLHVTVDRLLGGWNMGLSVSSGVLSVEPGLLAQAHGGVVYVDEINLLDPTLLAILLQTLDRGQVVLEREGISRRFPAQFCLIGTCNPAEGELPPALQERVAFLVRTRTLQDVETRFFIARQAGQRLILPEDMVAAVHFARKILPTVTISKRHLQEICAVASRTGVQGNRAEIFAVRCARANAALHRRTMVTQGDVDLAIRLVFVPRGGGESLPVSEEMDAAFDRAEGSAQASRSSPQSARQGETTAAATHPNEATVEKTSRNTQAASGERMGSRAIADPGWREAASQMAGAVPLPGVRNGGRFGPSGRHAAGLNWQRGRHVRSLPGRLSQGRLDVLATLKQVALRGGLQGKALSDRAIEIRPEDIRIKQFRRRSGLLIIFAVDCSGSMVLNRLMAARQAAIQLLKEAYVYRDKIALVNFCRQEAQLLLPPGGGLARATRILKQMPAGGRTPLPSAFLKVWEMTRNAASRWKVAGSMLVLITDGRGNEPLTPREDKQERRAQAEREARQLAMQLREHLVASLVIDTRKIFVPDGHARQLANWLGGHYVYLPDVQSEVVTALVRSEIQRIR
ncbi:MAG: AAA domain-containing protein [Calditrichaeota bacterium]|nr:AAA domain-containing protein [Calditrichota bacterium]